MKGKEKVIGAVINILLDILSPEMIQKILNKSLDFVEEAIEESGPTLDDKLVLPLLRIIRDLIN